MNTKFRAVLFVTALAVPVSAQAQDFTVYGGVTATTNYVFRSVTFSDDNAAIQPYLELESHGFYAGVWASNVDFGTGDPDDCEIDYYAGYRGETPGGFTYDVNYTRFTFNSSGDCCGEINLNLGLPVNDQIGLSAAFAYDPDAETLASGIGASFALNDAFSVSGVFGHDEALSHDYWDFGANYAFGENSAVDLRYFDTENGDSIIALSVSYDVTLFSR